MRTVKWFAMYENIDDCPKSPKWTRVGGFKSKDEAQEFVNDDKTDIAVRVRLGWTKFSRLEERSLDLGDGLVAEEVKEAKT